MLPVTPASADELAALLKDAAARSRTISVAGNNSKHLMAGPVRPADLALSTSGLNRLLQYEPNDLTISVEAGMPWAALQALLAGRQQMVALDPPFWPSATVGGVLAANSSGPLRRAYGTARDLVIGMQFATLEGKLIRAGGMVVKNVAGLDMGKLLIGSFGTLAVLTSVNFRLHPLPTDTRTFLFSFSDVDSAVARRDLLLSSQLRPLAADLLSPAAAAQIGLASYTFAIRAAGSSAVLDRYTRDLAGAHVLSGREDEALWTGIREFAPDFLRRQEDRGIVLRISTPLGDLRKLHQLVSHPCLSRALTGISYVFLTSWEQVSSLWKSAAENNWSLVVEYAPDELRSTRDLWLLSSTHDAGFAIMKEIKHMFDPGNLLNRSRLYGRI